MENTTRSRMVEAALALFQKQGYSETSWRELVKEGGTPWGSAHHFFPGGKEELASEALALFQKEFREGFDAICAEHPNPADRVQVWFENMASEMEANGYQSGCPVAGVALNTVPMSASLADICRKSMAGWLEYLANKITTDEIDSDEALSLANVILSCCEGALILARVSQSTRSLRLTGDHLSKLLRDHESGSSVNLPETNRDRL